MAFPATTVIPIQKTVTAAGADIPRGSRVTLGAGGTVTASAIGVRGDYIVLQDIPAGTKGVAAPLGAGGSVPVIASELVAVGDPAYSAATGQVSKTTGGGALLVGKWLQATAANTLGVIELETVA